VFVALGIQYAMHMRHTVLCGLRRYTVFYHVILQMARFSKKVIGHKMSVSSFCTTFVGNIVHYRKKLARCDQATLVSRTVPFLLFYINESLSGHIFEKYTNTKFHENPSSGSRVVPSGRMDGQA
jgi:hypothetical protein